MPVMTLPFKIEDSDEAHNDDPFSCSLFKMLPEPMQESSVRSPYLLEYLHMLPVRDIGLPLYHATLTRQMGKVEQKNLIYPVEGGLFIHVIDDPEGGACLLHLH